ncbi:hypothetical protein SK128_010336 [Halocaridina rubra]|uniref:Uncharacterized protein n=1 Tax=Halocaridina rubra TaxID=373956 RepID=A0AAN8ZYH7_HALRR
MAVVTLLNAIAAIFFVWLSFYIVKAKEKVADAIKETQANEQKLSSVTYGNDSKPDGADEVDNCYPTDTKNSLEGNDNPSFINAEKNI